eukprot:7378725-Prymnesium_polylepis.1
MTVRRSRRATVDPGEELSEEASERRRADKRSALDHLGVWSPVPIGLSSRVRIPCRPSCLSSSYCGRDPASTSSMFFLVKQQPAADRFGRVEVIYLKLGIEWFWESFSALVVFNIDSGVEFALLLIFDALFSFAKALKATPKGTRLYLQTMQSACRYIGLKTSETDRKDENLLEVFAFVIRQMGEIYFGLFTAALLAVQRVAPGSSAWSLVSEVSHEVFTKAETFLLQKAAAE